MGPPKFIKQILTDIKGKTDNSSITVENFNSPITSMVRLTRQKVYKETLILNDTLTIYRTKRQPTEWEKIFANDMSDKGLIYKTCKWLI